MLSEAQRKFLIHDQVIGGGVINGLLNALLGWLSFRHHDRVPMHGDPSIVADTIATAVLLPLIACLIVTPLVRKAIKAGKVEPLRARSIVLWLPRLSFLRGLVLGLLTLATLAPLMLGLYLLFGVETLSVTSFVIIKALYAGVMAALISPVIALYVLSTHAPAPANVASELAVG